MRLESEEPTEHSQCLVILRKQWQRGKEVISSTTFLIQPMYLIKDLPLSEEIYVVSHSIRGNIDIAVKLLW